MANTDFGILLKTMLDKSGINTELEQVQKIVNKYSVAIMPELQTASLRNQMKSVAQDIANDFNKAFGTNLTGNDVFKAFENQAKQAEKAIKDQAKAIEKARQEQEKYIAKVRESSAQAQSDKANARIKEANSLLSQQKNAYQEIWNINKQLSSLDPEKDSNQISSLNDKKKLYQDIYLSTQKQLRGYGDIISNEERMKALAEVRKKIETEIAIIQGKLTDSDVARVAKESAQAEKERLATLEKQRIAQANIAKEKAKTNSQQELAQQKEINAILSKQESAYKEIWSINKQIATLDPTKNSDQISALNEKKKFYQEIYLSAQKELQAYNNIAVSQEHLSSLAEIRKKAESEIGVAVAKQNEILAKAQAENVNKIQHSLDVGDYDAQIETIKKGFVSLSGDANEAETHVKGLRDALQSMHDATDDNGRLTAEKKYQLELEKTNNQLTIAKAKAKEYVDVLKVQKLRNDIQDWLKKNTAATKEAKDAMNAYLATLDDVGHVSQSSFNVAKQGLDDWDTKMRQAGKLGSSLTETFKEGVKSFTSWAVSSGVVMEVWQGLKRVYDEAVKLDSVMTDFAMATDLTASQMESVVDKWSDLGEDLNATTSDMIASGTEWIKQGQSIADTEKLITSAMVLDKVGKLENAQATEYLTSAMKGYKVAVEDTMDIVDKLSAVDMASATDVGGLAEAMSQVANNANIAGVSMDKLLGYIAVIGETTGEGMSSVGTGLNAIFSRMGNIKLSRLKDYQNNGEDLSNVETVLRGEGIVLRDSANEFRNFGEVLDEVAGRWTSFSEVSQRAIASAFAGTNHMEQFMVLMEGYGKATEYTEKSLNSSGEAMQKFEDYQKSVTAHTELFNKSIQDLANTAIDSGLVNFFIDCGTGLVKLLDGTMNLLTPLGALGITLGGILGTKNAGICV